MIAISKGLNFKPRDSLSALEPSDMRTFRVLPFSSASARSKFSIVAVNDDIMNSNFHFPRLCRGRDHSSCSRKSSSATCSSDSREGRVFDADSSFMMQLGVSGREQDFPTSVSEREQDFSASVSDREQGFSLAVSEREHRCAFRVVSICRLLRDCDVTRFRSSLASPSNLWKMHSGLFCE